jgi:hypothetical protein
MEENTEFEPLTELASEYIAPAPPAPTVTVYETPAAKLNPVEVK